jgi:hypothetical protein
MNGKRKARDYIPEVDKSTNYLYNDTVNETKAILEGGWHSRSKNRIDFSSCTV